MNDIPMGDTDSRLTNLKREIEELEKQAEIVRLERRKRFLLGESNLSDKFFQQNKG